MLPLPSSTGSRRRTRAERRVRFEALYAAHYEAIYRYVARRLFSDHEVPDVVADVFTTAWRRLDQVPEDDATRLWLYGVARNCVSNYQRGTHRRWRLLSRLTFETTTAVDTQPVVEGREAAVLDAIERLPDANREALRLVAWDGCTYAEAAQVLGCSVSAVTMRIHKAKAQLREDPLLSAELETSQPDHDRALRAQRK